MEFGVISVFQLTLVIVMLLPNLHYAILHREQRNRCENKWMNLMEQVGRYGSMALMVLPLGVGEFGFSSAEAMLLWMFGSLALLLAYLIVWMFFFRKATRGLAVVLAVIPTAIFLLCGVTLGHWLLVVSAVLFGIGHIYVTRRNWE